MRALVLYTAQFRAGCLVLLPVLCAAVVTGAVAPPAPPKVIRTSGMVLVPPRSGMPFVSLSCDHMQQVSLYFVAADKSFGALVAGPEDSSLSIATPNQSQRVFLNASQEGHADLIVSDASGTTELYGASRGKLGRQISLEERRKKSVWQFASQYDRPVALQLFGDDGRAIWRKDGDGRSSLLFTPSYQSPRPKQEKPK